MPGFENYERDIERDAIAATDKIKRGSQIKPLNLTERARAAGYRTDDDNFLADEVLPARPHNTPIWIKNNSLSSKNFYG